jgi:putative flavoprotein involved in K+ transport
VAAQGGTGEEVWEADSVVVATGGYHVPVVPTWASAIDPAVTQLGSARYRNAASLPEGAVLVVGSGQSGAQIAEDLHLEGRRVHLAVGGAPRVARSYRGRDVMTWLAEMGLYDTPVQQYPGGLAAREKTNHYVTGRDGGRDIDLRQFALEGMRLYGLLDSGRGTRLTFRPTLTGSLDRADSVYNSICRDIDRYVERAGIDAPEGRHYEPVWAPASDPRELDLAEAGITTIIWAIGYRPDYRWMRIGVFDGTGHPTHTRGVTAVPGLYFLGLPWLHTWGSGRFHGIARDAGHIVDCIAGSGSRTGTGRAGTGHPETGHTEIRQAGGSRPDGAAVADWIAGGDWIIPPVGAADLTVTAGSGAAGGTAGGR